MKKKQENDRDFSLQKIVSLLQNNEPHLEDLNEIPKNVMQLLQQEESKQLSERDPASPVIRYLILAQRWLVAASVCLLVLYGVEEFTVVSKLNSLEKHTSSIKVDPSGILTRQLILKGLSDISLQQRFPARFKLLVAESNRFPSKIATSSIVILP
ncbi:MAG: hypothetical protein JXA23_05665 [Bacteroidales bacterium]|nr:hypothetical protein [Bacteroidales bacterium]